MVALYPDAGVRALPFEQVKEAVETDKEMNEFATAIQLDTFPDKVSSQNRFHGSLTVVDGVAMYRRKMFRGHSGCRS